MFRIALTDPYIAYLLLAQGGAHLRVRFDGDDVVGLGARSEGDGEFARAGAELEDVCAGDGGEV
jgi:hypothetical protein